MTDEAMTRVARMTDENDDVALSELEFNIQKLLLDFVNKHGCVIDYVYVDTRNFANLDVEISLERKKK